MRYDRLSVLSILATVPLASLTAPDAPPWDDMRVKHAWDAVPAKWESLGPPPAGITIDLYVALKPHNENILIDTLYKVSDPSHPRQVLPNTSPRTMYLRVPLLRCRYGAHLSKEDVAKLVAPHPDTLELVQSWLEHHGVPSSSISVTHGGGWLTLTGVPVSQANELLGASYQLYRHAGTNDSTILRTVGYALPAVLHTHVQTVTPTTYFGSMRTLQQIPRRPSDGAAAARAKVGSREPATVMSSRDEQKEVTPEFLRSLYKTVAYVPAANGWNALGIAGYVNQYPSPTDLTTFMTMYRTDAVAATYTVERVNGGKYKPSRPGFEGNVNMQYAQAMAYPTPHIYYSTGGALEWTAPGNQPDPEDAFLKWFGYMLSQRYIPQTITTSYGIDEKELPLEYATTVCNLFLQLGARGVSVLFPSGDKGVGTGDCKVGDGSGRVQFIPLFPASCMCASPLEAVRKRRHKSLTTSSRFRRSLGH